MNDRLQEVLDAVERQASGYSDDLAEFVRIASVSTAREHREDIDAAAAWTAARLRRAGVPEVQVLDTAGHPVVVGRWQVAADLPTVVIYGHYDVQPAEPLELWHSPAFEPEVRDGKLYGRGASDDKGGVMVAIQAVEAWASVTGALPVNVTFLIEGEEEVGSPNLPGFLADHAELLAGDLAISADGGIYGVGVPSLTVSSRGLGGCEIVVRGAAADLHSGTYGGPVPNPLAGLARILASFHDDDGRVAVPGFYDGVEEPTEAQRRALAATPTDDTALLAELGLKAWSGEVGYSALELRTLRPTLEINGMGGGYQGPGIKTVLPSEARAKVTCRLVIGQDPDRIVEAIAAQVKALTPTGMSVEVTPLPGKGKAYAMPLDHPVLVPAARAMEAVFGLKPFPVWQGGTVPVAESFMSQLGMWCLYFAFGEPDNGLHAPNEFVRVDMLRKGTLATVRLLGELAQTPLND